MTYEIVLTDMCTRECNFCWVSKTGYIASHTEIQKFIDLVLLKEKDKQRKIHISLFGGEPLLNQHGIQQIVDAFSNNANVISIDISTNADLIENFLQNFPSIVQKLSWGISAYDFFNDTVKQERYLSLAKTLNSTLMYTFTKLDIYKAREFSRICWNNNIKFKIAFSHSSSSWTNFKLDDLYHTIFDLIYEELVKTITEYPNFSSIAIMKPLRLVIGHLFNEKHSDKKCRWCLDCNEKLSFFKGEFVGSCMQESIKKLPHKLTQNYQSINCKSCEYNQICMKSCIFEHDEIGNVPDSLCTIEKAQLDAFCKFAKNYKHDFKWRLVLKQIIESDFNYERV